MLAEVSPIRFRAKSQAILFSSWAIGSELLVAAAYLVIPYGWRWFLVCASAPLILSFVPSLFIPESIRYLALTQQHNRADAVIRRISRDNKRPIPPNLDIKEFYTLPTKQKGSIKLVFHHSLLVLTLIQLLIWFIGALLYYGAVILSTALPTLRYPCLQDPQELSTIVGNMTDNSCCEQFTSSYYANLAISSLGDLASALVIAFGLDPFGRKIGTSICGWISALVFILLDLCMPIWTRSLLLLTLRCFTLSFIDALYVYTTELYPTTIRSTAFGVLQGASRIGGMVTPFLAQVMLHYNTRMTLFVYSGLSVVGAIAVLLLPKETVNMPLSQVLEEDKIRLD